eukprot:TRINITY_DN6383_c0_g1_i2.p1 TRINITY_DN6383_c0_g1~~TRINITY_DN6383_c0_g1_i2.p1  ORF type:complete len:283 (+),score=12.79 TRINITY_DN6383_c0_g1_i2:91-939(+)
MRETRKTRETRVSCNMREGRERGVQRLTNAIGPLQVAPDASRKDVRKAFRTLSLKYHPDKLSAELSAVEKERIADEYQKIIRAKAVLDDTSLRSAYDTMVRNGIPWVERYYNRYAYRYGAPRTSPFTILLILAAVLTLLQYMYKLSRFRRAIFAVKRSQRYRTALKKIEYSSECGESEREESEGDSLPTVSIHGIHSPQLDDLLPIQLFTMPYKVMALVRPLLTQSSGSVHDRGLSRALELGYTEEEYEQMVENAERRRKRILSSSKYKRYKRMGKKAAQGR